MIENHFLHAVAWGLLRVLPPRSAFRWTARIGRVFPPIRSRATARQMAETLEAHGTCLSRAVTVASRIPDAEVVIGVDARSLPARAPFTAHAWVDLNGTPLREEDARPGEIVRFKVGASK